MKKLLLVITVTVFFIGCQKEDLLDNYNGDVCGLVLDSDVVGVSKNLDTITYKITIQGPTSRFEIVKDYEKNDVHIAESLGGKLHCAPISEIKIIE